MAFGIITPLGVVSGIMGYSFSLSLYGFATTDPLSLVGLFIITLFMVKGLAAVSLWLEQDWAINLAMVDAWIGIIACVFVMFIHPFIDEREGFTFSMRLELLLLIPYLIKLQKIRPQWMFTK